MLVFLIIKYQELYYVGDCCDLNVERFILYLNIFSWQCCLGSYEIFEVRFLLVEVGFF